MQEKCLRNHPTECNVVNVAFRNGSVNLDTLTIEKKSEGEIFANLAAMPALLNIGFHGNHTNEMNRKCKKKIIK